MARNAALLLFLVYAVQSRSSHHVTFAVEVFVSVGASLRWKLRLCVFHHISVSHMKGT